ncbi:class I SAM-dependent methyltransferase [Nocardioides currus]|uniref:Class I SAM-dependent methyltransferase n=1 Tax=Nocardioides currus TaxID=2133958 RepID=A0A2R7Z0X5_9ACTN|nr:class I SAM-dependent methyltransferase [Nocardioides currus]PUA82281.1 class I SAM-dependent methyltransferase [Nocardioides currus]
MDAAAWDARYAASELVWSRGPNQFVEAECAGLPPGRAVDLACGEGRNAIWLASIGWDVTAVDFSQVALDKGRTLAGDLPVDWVCADATTWTGTDLDLAVVAYFQVPGPMRRTAIRNLVSSLRTGGTLVWVAHDSTNLTEGTGGPQDPAVLMTAEDLLADLSGLDVEVVRAGRVARVVTADDPHGSEVTTTAWDCLLRLVRR